MIMCSYAFIGAIFSTPSTMAERSPDSSARVARLGQADDRSAPIAEAPSATEQPTATATPTTEATPTAEATPVTAATTIAPEATETLVAAAAGPAGTVTHFSKIRPEPSAWETPLGAVCPYDQVEYLDQHQALLYNYYQVRIVALGADCDRERVGVDTIGWMYDINVSVPAIDGKPAPTAIPPSPTRLPPPTRTRVPATPTPVLPPVGEAAVVANLRSEPQIRPNTVIGKLCPGDTLNYLTIQKIGSELWYSVEVTAIGAACDPQHVAVGATGWARSDVVPVPSDSVYSYLRRTGRTPPPDIPATAIPATATPRPAPRPLAPATGTRRVGAICQDGWQSSATGRGACSHHGGVAYWLYGP
jgi:hypothetical protein